MRVALLAFSFSRSLFVNCFFLFGVSLLAGSLLVVMSVHLLVARSLLVLLSLLLAYFRLRFVSPMVVCFGASVPCFLKDSVCSPFAYVFFRFVFNGDLFLCLFVARLKNVAVWLSVFAIPNAASPGQMVRRAD